MTSAIATIGPVGARLCRRPGGNASDNTDGTRAVSGERVRSVPQPPGRAGWPQRASTVRFERTPSQVRPRLVAVDCAPSSTRGRDWIGSPSQSLGARCCLRTRPPSLLLQDQCTDLVRSETAPRFKFDRRPFLARGCDDSRDQGDEFIPYFLIFGGNS
jgi:hypothetical protein